MKKSKRLPNVVAIIYVLLFAHFLISNTVKVLGPSYLLKATTNETISSCSLQENLSNDCACSSSNSNDVEHNLSVNDSPPPPTVGFPFISAHSNTIDNCGNYGTTQSQDTAGLLNFAYIAVITIIFGSYYVWLTRKLKRKH